MSIVTVSIVQNVSVQRATPDGDSVSVGSAVTDIITTLHTATGLDWGTLAVTVTDDPVQ